MKYLIRILGLLFCVQHIHSWRSFLLPLNAVQCANLGPVTSYVNCSIGKTTGHPRTLMLNVRFGTDIKTPTLDVAIVATRPQPAADFVIMNITDMDGCAFFSKNGTLHILSIIRETFDEFSDFPNKCPITKDTVINVKNLYLNPEKFPPYLPETNFSVRVLFANGKTPLFRLNVDGSVLSKNRVRFRRPANSFRIS